MGKRLLIMMNECGEMKTRGVFIIGIALFLRHWRWDL